MNVVVIDRGTIPGLLQNYISGAPSLEENKLLATVDCSQVPFFHQRHDMQRQGILRRRHLIYVRELREAGQHLPAGNGPGPIAAPPSLELGSDMWGEACCSDGAATLAAGGAFFRDQADGEKSSPPGRGLTHGACSCVDDCI